MSGTDKNILIVSLTFGFVLCLWLLSFADIVVIYDKTTKEIYTASDKDDTIVPEGCEKKILPGSITDFTTEPPTNYKLSGSKFIKDIDKISKGEEDKKKAEEIAAEQKMINDKLQQIAITALKAEGKTFKWLDK